jgi:hypothetical protein
MKVLGNESVVKVSNVNFPFGGSIQNETETQEGTPVGNYLFDDILANIYKLLQLAGITPTNTFDSDTTQYQIVQALQLLPNNLNDIERVLTVTGPICNVPLNLNILPKKYFFLARASDDYVAGTSYFIRGSTTNPTYPIVTDGFKSGDELLVIVDNTTRIYSLSQSTSNDSIALSFDSPLAFNETNIVRYQHNGRLINDGPSINDLQSIIRVETSDATFVVNDILVLKGFVLCFCFSPTTDIYAFYQFDLNDLATPFEIDAPSFDREGDNNPYVYTDGTHIYITNGGNYDVADNSIRKYSYDTEDGSIAVVNTTTINASFVKTKNAVIKSGILYTMISGVLESYNLTSGAKISMGTYPSTSGDLFSYNGQVYYGSGEVAKKWF